MIEPKTFNYLQSVITYHRYGKGTNTLVAFHGYNQTGAEFAYFEDVLGEYFTIIAIDFFEHGGSKWNETFDFTDKHMKEILEGIALQENILNKRFSVCSYSMGARLARALVRNFPHKIDYFILLSPPTKIFNRFLSFTVNNPVGLSLFQYFVKHPQALQNWVKRLHQLKILNRSIYVFTSKFVGRRNRIEKVYKTWFAQRKLKTNLRSFSNLLNQHNITTILIVGKSDNITPSRSALTFMKKIKNKRIFILPKKHELATPETRQVFSQLFNK
ncbi:MAG: alpha/beta hydrolase [Bacteroidia bacterium]|nr:alpha/beta hydrolase [Bacteroidia bacterium]